MTSRDIEWKLICGIDTRLLTRRRFLSTHAFRLGVGLRARLFWEGRILLAEAAELSREMVIVDIHCHPDRLAGLDFPDLTGPYALRQMARYLEDKDMMASPRKAV